MPKSPFNTDAPPALPTAAVAALHKGNKIEATKVVRQERNLGLKEAKDLVDDYVERNPALQSSFAEMQTRARRTVLLWLVVLVICLALVAYVLLGKP